MSLLMSDLFRELFDSSNLPSFRCTLPRGRLLALNSKFEETFGVARTHMDETTWWSTLCHGEVSLESWLRQLRDSEMIELQCRLLAFPSCKIRLYANQERTECVGMIAPDGTPPAASSESVKLDFNTRGLPHLITAGISSADILDDFPVSVLLKDRSGRRIYANQLYLRMRRVTAEEILGKTDFELFDEELAAQYHEDDLTVMSSQQVMRGVEEVSYPDGERFWIERVKAPLLDQAGEVCGVQILFWDVSQREVAERNYENERHLINTLLENIPDSIYFKDRESRFLRISRAMAVKLGLNSVEDAIGKTDADIFTEEHARQARADEIRIMETREPLISRVEKETWHDRPDTWCSTTKMPLYDAAGQVVGTFGISRDITNLKHATEELRAAKETADESNRAKSDFLANMSHEIRTPMNAVIGMTELLMETELTETQSKYLRMVHDSGEALLDLINDILDFSKIEANKLELDAVEFHLQDTIGDLMKALALRAHAKGLELISRISPNVPEYFIGDCGRLRQILINLVGNAIKFTEKGEVLVEVDLDEIEDEKAKLRFRVRDTGIGIDPSKLDRIFEAFEQADSTTTRRYGGTGLGLSITARLVELLGGTIAAHSEAGQGSLFQFTCEFVLAGDVPPEARTLSLEGMAKTRVLIVDDNRTNCEILEEILKARGIKSQSVYNANDALERLATKMKKGRPFDLVMTDLNMPDIDGMMLVERIRGHEKYGNPMVIMLTSAERPGDRDRGRRLGIGAHLMKPVKQSELVNAMVRVCHGDGIAESSASIPILSNDTRVLPLKILLAEDARANQILAVGVLERWKHDVTIVETGRAVLEKLEQEHFDLILMDVQMPEMDGIEATRSIRQTEREADDATAHVPIIAMTAHALKGDRERCLAAGMDGYISKPLRIIELKDVIEQVIAEHAPELLDENSAQADSAQESEKLDQANERSEEEPSAEDASQSHVDFQLALERSGGNRKLMHMVFDAFLKECPARIEQIQQAVQANELKEVAKTAHAIKGICGSVGASAAYALATKIEQSCQHGASDLEALTKEFTSTLKEVMSVLRKRLARQG